MTAAETHVATPQSPTQAHWPAPTSRAVLLCFVALMLGMGAAYGLSRANASSSLGYLEAESAVVSAGVTGRIEEVAAGEGARVEPGKKLLVVVDEMLESQLSALRRRVDVLHSELNQAHAQADVDLRWRMKELESELLEIRLKSAGFLQSQYDQEIEQFAWSDFLKESLIDPLEFFTDAAPQQLLFPAAYPAQVPRDSRMKAAIRKAAASNALEVSQAQIEMCTARMKELEVLKQDLPKQIVRSHGVEVIEARLADASEELSRLESRPRNVELKSPIHGTVGVYLKAKGDRIVAGESIVMILDEDQRFLTLRIPSRQAPQYPAGGRVLLDFPGGQTRVGQVRTIPPQAVAGNRETSMAISQDSVISLRIDPLEKLWPAVPVGTAIQVRPVQ